ncbi:hypothetical protein [Bradyrhizobium uaiense]|uniref:hypothetical protein n=1 Tax=Bradyrhizobium uaiense TaxID=2594946 RepID=UPI001F1FA48E|nr:hypothetical protein [Bradyrhizobium uaiense]
MSHPVSACHPADRLAGLQGLFDKADLLIVTPSPPTLTFSLRMFWFSQEVYKGRTTNRFDTFEALSRFLIECVGKEKPS